MGKIIFVAVRNATAQRVRGINISKGDETFHFKPGSINAGKVERIDLFMSSCNALFSNFTDEHHDAIFEVYRHVAEIRDMPILTQDDMFALDESLKVFFDIITPEGLTAWGRGNPNYATAHSITEIAPMRDGGVSSSCTAEEYKDISTLSTLFKLLIPFQELSTQVAEMRPNLVGLTNWTLFEILNGAGGIDQYPAYTHLITKAKSIADSLLGKGVPMGLTAEGVGEDEFYRLLLIKELFRDVTRLETELAEFENGVNNNLSFKIHYSLTNYINHDIRKMFQFNTTQGAPRAEDEGGNVTRQESKAGGEERSSIYGLYFNRDYLNFVDVITHSTKILPELKIDPEDVNALAAQYPKGIEMAQPQFIISGTLFHEAIPMESSIYRPENAVPFILAYTALIAKKLNLPNIYKLMLCVDDVDGHLTESERRNSVIGSPIVHPLLGKVLDEYPSDEGGNPFEILVESLARTIVRTNFVIAVSDDKSEIGEEWYPTLIEDRGFKDEMVSLIAAYLEVE